MGNRDAALDPGRVGRLAAWAVVVTALAVAVKGGHLVRTDYGLAQWMAEFRTPGRDAAAHALTFFGSSPWALGVMGVMSVRWRHQRLRLAVFWGVWLLGLGLHVVLRFWTAHVRPDAWAAPTATHFIAYVQLAGFPSGHAFRATFLYGWWADWLSRCHRPSPGTRRRWVGDGSAGDREVDGRPSPGTPAASFGEAKRAGVGESSAVDRKVNGHHAWAVVGGLGCAGLIILVGLTRIYLNHHWFTDVAGGWALGLLALALAQVLEPRASKAHATA